MPQTEAPQSTRRKLLINYGLEENQRSKMHFVGYTDGFNTFRFYNPVAKGLVTSCDVLFIDRFGPISQFEIDESQGQTSGKVEIATNIIPPTSLCNLDCNEPGDQAEEVDSESENSIEPVSPQEQGRSVETMSEHGSRCMDAEDVSTRQGHSTENVEASQNRSEAHQRPFDIEDGDIIFRRPDFFRRSTPRTTSRQPSSTEMSTISEVPSHSLRTPTAPLLSSPESLEHRVIEQPRVEQNVVSIEEGTAEQTQHNNAENRPSLRRSQRSTSNYNYNDLAKGRLDLRFAKAATMQVPPSNFSKVLERDDCEDWIRAMQEEMNQMVRLEVFKLVRRPTQNVVSCRWVFTYKNQKPKASSQRFHTRTWHRLLCHHCTTGLNGLCKVPILNCSRVQIDRHSLRCQNGFSLWKFEWNHIHGTTRSFQ